MTKLSDLDYDVLCCLPKAPIGVSAIQIAMDVCGDATGQSRRRVLDSLTRLGKEFHIPRMERPDNQHGHRRVYGIGPEDWQRAQGIGKAWWDANR